jgi:hypothetical protein
MVLGEALAVPKKVTMTPIVIIMSNVSTHETNLAG